MARGRLSVIEYWVEGLAPFKYTSHGRRTLTKPKPAYIAKLSCGHTATFPKSSRSALAFKKKMMHCTQCAEERIAARTLRDAQKKGGEQQ